MKLPMTSPYNVGDKLYAIGLHYKDRPPLHIVAVLTDAASDPWPWLLVVREWWPHKQRWNHALLNPLEVKTPETRSMARFYPTRAEAAEVMERA